MDTGEKKDSVGEKEELKKIYQSFESLLGEAPPLDGDKYMYRDEFVAPGGLQPTHTLSSSASLRIVPSEDLGLDLFTERGINHRQVYIANLRPVYFHQIGESERSLMGKTFFHLRGNHRDSSGEVVTQHFLLAPDGDSWSYETWVNDRGAASSRAVAEKPSLDLWQKALVAAQAAPTY